MASLVLSFSFEGNIEWLGVAFKGDVHLMVFIGSHPNSFAQSPPLGILITDLKVANTRSRVYSKLPDLQAPTVENQL